MKSKAFTGLSQVGPHVGVLIHLPKISTPPLSLYIAKRDPVSVIQPTNAESPAATIATVAPRPGSGEVVSIHFHVSDSATSADAAPPKPLNSATNSGIPVISTLTAMMYPISEPIRIPEPIKVHPTIPSGRKFMCTIVVTTAIAIPSIPYWLPLGAVRGWPNFFRPNMKKIAETK